MDAAIRAVLHASRLTTRVRAKFSAAEMALTKADMSPVTVADFGAQCLISLYLRAKLPGEFRLVAEEDAATLRAAGDQMLTDVAALVNEHFPFAEIGREVGEEFAPGEILEVLERSGDKGGSDGGFWFLDPIDGTKGFVRGGQYAVGLGRVVNGEVQGVD